MDKPLLLKSVFKHQYPVPENLLYAATLKHTQRFLTAAHKNKRNTSNSEESVYSR